MRPGSRARVARVGYWRTAVIAVASIGLLAGSWSAASGQDASSGSTDASTFSAGTAKATAVVARVAPGVGSLQLGISSGVAVSQIQNTVASSQAETLDLGLLGSTLTVSSCSLPAPLKPDQIPKPLTVDSRHGATSGSADEYPIAGSTLGAGHKQAAANPSPESSSAVATIVSSVIPGLLTISGGTSKATTKVVDGDAREAHASVDVDLDIGNGALKLQGLTWTADHRTGKDPSASASFDIGTASIAGVPIPTQSLVQLEDAVNKALAFTGISITFPELQRFTTPADLVRMTPLRIVLQDSPAGKAVLGPVLNLTRTQREQLFNQLTAALCPAAGALLVGDIGLDVASGTGFLAVEIGGAEATSGDLTVDNLFGNPQPPSEATLPGLPLPAAIPSYLPTFTAPAPVAASQRAASVGPLTDKCESAHPKHHTACSKGDALAVGLVGLFATAGMGGLDWRHQRRRRARAAAGAGA